MALTLAGYRKLFGELPEGVVLGLDDAITRAKERNSGKAALILKQEKRRLMALERHERLARKTGFRCIAGVDEVGRGPLAGPLVAAAVVFKGQPWIPMLDDSKKLTPQIREALVTLIRMRAQAIGIGVISVEELNVSNVHVASLEAMRRAISTLDVAPDYILVDGLHCVPGHYCRQQTLVRGDSLSLSVAAASIVAKVTRDRQMDEMDLKYPHYGFRHNKGYATVEHRAALRTYGPCPIHRVLFSTVAALKDVQLSLFDDN